MRVKVIEFKPDNRRAEIYDEIYVKYILLEENILG